MHHLGRPAGSGGASGEPAPQEPAARSGAAGQHGGHGHEGGAGLPVARGVTGWVKACAYCWPVARFPESKPSPVTVCMVPTSCCVQVTVSPAATVTVDG